MNLQVFNFNQNEIRVILGENDEPWFIAKEVCDILEHSNHKVAIKSLDEDEVNKVYLIDNLGRQQQNLLINESGLYTLIIRSNKPEAKKFRKWVTSEVLPSIRKHGAYAVKNSQSVELLDTVKELTIALQKERSEKEFLQFSREVYEMRWERTKAELEELKKLVDSKPQLLIGEQLYSATQIASEMGLTAHELNTLLHNKGIQYRKGGYWVLYKKYNNFGYTQLKSFEKQYQTITYMAWTEKGRKFIHEIID